MLFAEDYATQLINWASNGSNHPMNILRAVFSDAALKTMEESSSSYSADNLKQRVRRAILVDAKKTCLSGECAGILAMHALASVCEVKLHSIYPEVKDTATLRKFFNTTILPRSMRSANQREMSLVGAESGLFDVLLLSSPRHGHRWPPNHFVPLLGWSSYQKSPAAAKQSTHKK